MKIKIIFIVMFIGLMSCKKDVMTMESYIGNFSPDYILTLNLREVNDEREQKEMVQTAFDGILAEKNIKEWKDMQIYRISDGFFAFSISLNYNDMVKLRHDKRLESVALDGTIGL